MASEACSRSRANGEAELPCGYGCLWGRGRDRSLPTRVMIVEDRADLRRLLANLLNRQADLEVVAEVGSLRVARDHAARAILDKFATPSEILDAIRNAFTSR